MALVRPRLTDYFEIALTQDEADFAIPFLDEDIPLCVDPFPTLEVPVTTGSISSCVLDHRL